jgi:Lon protease-like protein
VSDTRTVPLFPLATVLFPGTALPLYIFEARYRIMVRRCLEADRTLGIVLIREGWEVGEEAVPFDVGTLSRLSHVQARADNTFDVTVVGEQRFRIRSLVRGEPYLQAEVEALSDEPAEGDVTADLLTGLRRDFLDYLRILRGTRQLKGALPAVTDPARLSHVVAATLRIPLVEKQALLEATLPERLALGRSFLRRELVLAHRLGTASPGHAPSPGEIPRN